MSTGTYYSTSEIRKRRAQQIGLGFSFPEGYHLLSDAEIAAAANGVGPDAFPGGARRLLTSLLPYADLAADIHDVEFQRSNGERPEFLAANERFRHNCRQWVMHNRSRLNPLLYVEQFRLRRDFEILNGDAGWEAWTSAAKRYAAQ